MIVVPHAFHLPLAPNAERPIIMTGARSRVRLCLFVYVCFTTVLLYPVDAVEFPKSPCLVTLLAMCVLWTLLMCWFRKRIRMAIAVTKEAARAVNDMKVEFS